MLLLFIHLFLYYVRPAEWIPDLLGANLLKVSGVFSILYIGAGAISGRFPNVLRGQTERMVLGFMAAIAMSHLSHLYFGGTIDSTISFLPTLTGFFLVISVVDNRKRLQIFLLFLIALTSFLAYEGWLQHARGYSHGGMEPTFDLLKTVDGETVEVPRIRWYGVFNDPNDLGLALVLVVPFLLNMLLQRRLLVPLITLPLISAAIYYTNSRGTILAGLVGIGSFFVIKHRSLYGVLVGGLLSVVLFLFGPSRMSSISAQEESAYGRIEAWHQAYQMFKSNPLFGVGRGMFTDFNNLTAHNSFVLVMAELGFVGLFFFTGIFYFPYFWLWKNILKSEQLLLSKEDLGLVSAAYASMTGILSAMFFLSRSYMLIPFMLAALVIALSRIIYNDLRNTVISDGEEPRHLRNIALLTIAQIVGINIVIKMIIV